MSSPTSGSGRYMRTGRYSGDGLQHVKSLIVSLSITPGVPDCFFFNECYSPKHADSWAFSGGMHTFQVLPISRGQVLLVLVQKGGFQIIEAPTLI